MKTARKENLPIFQPAQSAPKMDAAENGIDYTLLFQNALELAVIFMPVLDAKGKLADMLLHKVNPAFARLAGIEPEAVHGRLASQLFPGVELKQAGPRALWSDIAAVAGEGKTRRREVFFDLVDRHFLYHVFPLNDGLIALVGIDISAQKEAATALQENQERLSLCDARAQLQATQVQIQHKLIENREKERQSIANYLHEGLLQTLIGVRYAIEEGLSIDQKEIRLARLAAVQAVVQREIQHLRDYCNELRPPTLSPFGLEKTIRAHANTYQKKHAQPVLHLELSPDYQSLPEQTRLVLFRAFQELLKDAVARTVAGDVWVRFAFSAAQAVLEVEDNGQLSLPSTQWMDLASHGKIGLASALNRVEGLGGQVEFFEPQGKGTKVRVVVPIGGEARTV